MYSDTLNYKSADITTFELVFVSNEACGTLEPSFNTLQFCPCPTRGGDMGDVRNPDEIEQMQWEQRLPYANWLLIYSIKVSYRLKHCYRQQEKSKELFHTKM